MKQTKPTLFYSHRCWGIGKILGMITLLVLNFSLQATVVTQSITLDGLKLTISYNNVVCLSSMNTITYTLENTNSFPFETSGGPYNGIVVEGFTPDGTQASSSGLAFVSSTPPQPSGVVSYDPTSTRFECPGCDNTNSCTSINPAIINRGIGFYQASSGAPGPTQPFPPNIPYTWTITYQATSCGIQQYVGQFLEGDFNPVNSCLHMCDCFVIAILVIPYATLSNVAFPLALCNSSGANLTGPLPPPECPTDCTGALVPCGGTGSFPFHYTVSGVTGGTVTLLDPTAGIFSFIPDPGFQGGGQFVYNVVSDTTPSEFCSATAPATFTVPIILPPTTTPASFTSCINSTITGNLQSFVTGGSLIYGFHDMGTASCGSASVAFNGDFTFTGPTGPGSCTFSYEVNDLVFGCSGAGSATVTVFAGPTLAAQTLDTCIGQPVSGTLTAAGGTPPRVFSITTPPANGMITAFDASTGDFIYTPNVGFSGTDSFQYTATDSQGCSNPPATITINVDPQPVTSSTAFLGCEGTQLTGSLTGLVSGGTGTQVFSISGPSSQPCGILQIFSNGDFIFSPASFFTGTCDFAYSVTQGGCPGTGSDTLTFTIAPAPVATGASFNVCQFGNVTGDLNNYLLSSTGTTSFTAVGGPINGTLFLNPAGPFSFTATVASGTAGFNYEAISDILPCPSATEMITVHVHTNPRTTTGNKAVCSGTATMGSLTSLVAGTPPFTFTGPFSSVNGTTTITQNGVFTFTPNVGVTGEALPLVFQMHLVVRQPEQN